jgi:hypothetical protein
MGKTLLEIIWQGIYCTAARDRMGGILIRSSEDGAESYIQPGDDARSLAEAFTDCTERGDLQNFDALASDFLPPLGDE